MAHLFACRHHVSQCQQLNKHVRLGTKSQQLCPCHIQLKQSGRQYTPPPMHACNQNKCAQSRSHTIRNHRTSVQCPLLMPLNAQRPQQGALAMCHSPCMRWALPSGHRAAIQITHYVIAAPNNNIPIPNLMTTSSHPTLLGRTAAPPARPSYSVLAAAAAASRARSSAASACTSKQQRGTAQHAQRGRPPMGTWSRQSGKSS